MKIVIDTRGQLPFTFEGYEAETICAPLPAGDYSLAGLEMFVAVERKALPDLLNCLGNERERFFRELERLRGYETAAIVIESPLEVITSGRYRSRIKPEAVVQSIIAIQARYRVPVYFAPNKPNAEKFTYDFLRHYRNAVLRRFHACCDEDGENIGNCAKRAPNA